MEWRRGVIDACQRPWQRLYLRPLPQGQGALRPILRFALGPKARVTVRTLKSPTKVSNLLSNVHSYSRPNISLGTPDSARVTPYQLARFWAYFLIVTWESNRFLASGSGNLLQWIVMPPVSKPMGGGRRPYGALLAQSRTPLDEDVPCRGCRPRDLGGESHSSVRRRQWPISPSALLFHSVCEIWILATWLTFASRTDTHASSTTVLRNPEPNGCRDGRRRPDRPQRDDRSSERATRQPVGICVADESKVLPRHRDSTLGRGRAFLANAVTWRFAPFVLRSATPDVITSV